MKKRRMNLILVVGALMLAFTSALPVAAWDLQKEVTTEFVKRNGGFDMVAVNRLPVPVTATFTLSLTNMRSSAGERFTAVLAQDSYRIVSRVEPIDPSAGYWYRWEWHWIFGSAEANPDALGSFRLPYQDGERYELTEGYGSCPGHQDAMYHSLDWGMPEGTPIVAARDGVVAEVESRYSLPGGPEMRDRANFVVVVNLDGSITDYVHLRCGGVTVEPGQRVRAGEVIGYSGNTGWSTGPHLHFRVLRPVDGFRHESLPVRFVTAEGDNKRLEKGEVWTASPLPANAPSCGEK